MPLLGRFAGKMLKYRSAALMGMALIALGGCIPALFAPDWGFVLFCHGLGLGVGGALLGTFQHVLGKKTARRMRADLRARS